MIRVAGLFAALLGLVIGMLIPGPDAMAVFLLAIALVGWWWACDWKLLPDRRNGDHVEYQPVTRERRRRDYEVGR